MHSNHRQPGTQGLPINSSIVTTQALEVAVMCVGYQLFFGPFVAYWFATAIVSTRRTPVKLMLMNSRLGHSVLH